MELVAVAHIELHRPQSALAGGFGVPSNPREGSFVVENDDIETLRNKIIEFAENCGVNRAHLYNMKSASGYNSSHGGGVITFDIDIQGRQYSKPYATCKVEPALKIGNRCFKLSEILDLK